MALSKLDQLYRQVILDHSKHPHHHGELTESQTYELKNPTCGDVIQLHLQLDDGEVKEARFTGEGCSISTASASMMCDAIIGHRIEEVEEMIHDFSSLVQGEDVDNEALGDAALLSGVAKFPARIKCATLSWKALEHLLEEEKSETCVCHYHKEEE